MTFEQYQQYLAEAFPEAVRAMINAEVNRKTPADRMMQPCHDFYRDWGFSSVNQCWEEAVPRSQRMTLFAWGEAKFYYRGWRMEVTTKPLSIMHDGVHIEVHNRGDLPLPFTTTGYRSFFVPLCSFAGGKTVEDFLRSHFPEQAQHTQMALF